MHWKPSGRTKTPVLAFLDLKADDVIQVNGSMKGLGTVLLQKGRSVRYVSRTLTLAFQLERLHQYVFGSKVEVQADHKPLIPIWKKSIVAAHH